IPANEVAEAVRGSGLVRLGPKAVRAIRKLFSRAVREWAADIDEQVTSDPHRLTRIPNSLHGKTGLRALTISLSELSDIKPLRDAVGLPSDEVEVLIKVPVPRFRLGGEGFGPYEPGERVRLPLYCAALIALKGRGEVV
ncbi:MAG: hypothetical protein DRO06_04000, partial [Thermoproteota archaeon]